jgi:hypothetical protein
VDEHDARGGAGDRDEVRGALYLEDDTAGERRRRRKKGGGGDRE